MHPGHPALVPFAAALVGVFAPPCSLSTVVEWVSNTSSMAVSQPHER
jgi:hypothetical protein